MRLMRQMKLKRDRCRLYVSSAGRRRFGRSLYQARVGGADYHIILDSYSSQQSEKPTTIASFKYLFVIAHTHFCKPQPCLPLRLLYYHANADW